MKKLSFEKLETLSINLQLNGKQKVQLKGGDGGRRSGTVTVLDTDMESIVTQ